MGTAMVTGASAGLGVEFAWQLATANHDLVLVARNKERLEELAANLRGAAGVHVEVIAADLAEPRQLAKVAKRLRAKERPVGLLVNNAGYGSDGGFLDHDIEAEQTLLDVMVRAVLVLSHAAGREMRARGRGAILNVSSVAAYTAGGTYAAAKAWVKTFTEALAVELRGTGVTATALLPGLTHTEFHRRGGYHYDDIPEIAWLTPEQVVARALQDVRQGLVLSTPSVRYAVIGQVARVAPRWLIRRVEGRQ